MSTFMCMLLSCVAGVFLGIVLGMHIFSLRYGAGTIDFSGEQVTVHGNKPYSDLLHYPIVIFVNKSYRDKNNDHNEE